MPIRVLIADDTKVVRQAIRRVLEQHADMEIVGEAADFAQTIQMANDLKPQVVVMDLHMPNENEFTPPQIKSQLDNGSRLLAISVWNDEDARALAESFGAITLLDKIDLGKKLIPTILELVSSGADAAVG